MSARFLERFGRELARDVSDFVAEGGELFGLAFSFVQHLRERFEGRQRELKGHAILDVKKIWELMTCDENLN